MYTLKLILENTKKSEQYKEYDTQLLNDFLSKQAIKMNCFLHIFTSTNTKTTYRTDLTLTNLLLMC